jgi:hypothetical protein
LLGFLFGLLFEGLNLVFEFLFILKFQLAEEVFIFRKLFEVLFFEFVLLDDGLESFVLFFDR